MEQVKLTEILEKHKLWLEGGEGGEHANLRSADLSTADLSYADLRYADLRYADLRSANLSSADLRSADLSYADLSYADLRSANLRSADLSDLISIGHTSGNMEELKSLFLETWPITYTAEVMQIGCEKHPIADWWAFDDGRIALMDSEALEWWKKWKPVIQQIIELSPATPTKREETEAAA